MPQMRGQPHIELDGFYLDNHPSTPLPSSPRSDPVERHGQQFREMVTQQRERLKQQELLGKVFSSWQLRRADSSGPVSADVITNLKRTSRLLHYCSSPLLLLSHLNTAVRLSVCLSVCLSACLILQYNCACLFCLSVNSLFHLWSCLFVHFFVCVCYTSSSVLACPLAV